MLAEARRRLLLSRISQQGFAALEDLVTALGASESTIRRDLEALDAAGPDRWPSAASAPPTRARCRWRSA